MFFGFGRISKKTDVIVTVVHSCYCMVVILFSYQVKPKLNLLYIIHPIPQREKTRDNLVPTANGTFRRLFPLQMGLSADGTEDSDSFHQNNNIKISMNS